MSRLIAFGMLLAAVSTTGCCGWGPCGNEQFRGPFRGAIEGLCSTCGDDCCNCDGYNPPYGSLRKTLACGSGCGEIYYGEWMSNPPNTCNDCDARGHAYGINARAPWLCNPWRPMGLWGVQNRPTWAGYGNPYRAEHPGYADYGWNGTTLGCETGCSTGCPTGGCPTGNCAPNAPAGTKLQPIPKSAGAKRVLSRGVQVNYESPLIRASQTRNAKASQPAAKPVKQATNLSQPQTSTNSNSANRASLKMKSSTPKYGRLKQINSLR